MSSVYNTFGRGDILTTVMMTQPLVILASGALGPDNTRGWHGNTGGPSGSITLYEGVRSRTDVYRGAYGRSGISIYPLDKTNVFDIDGAIVISGSYPSTGSVRFVKCRVAPIASTVGASQQINPDNWYQEHWNPIESLFKYYQKYSTDFFTGSYDYYSLMFRQDDNSTDPAYVNFVGATLPTVTSSFTMEAWIKPTSLAGIPTKGNTSFGIQSQVPRWMFYIDTVAQKLNFTDFATTLTSSIPLTLGVWQYVAISVGNGSASFYVNLQNQSVAYTGTLKPSASPLLVGTDTSLTFSGMICESRIWDVARTFSQISSSYNSVLTSLSNSVNLRHYARFNDGPLSTKHGYSAGSGAFDYSPYANHGQLINMGAVAPTPPIWLPNDNTRFIAPKTPITDARTMVRVLHIPSMFYGRQIATGSFYMQCNAYDNGGIVRVIRDDGRGNLYISGSMCRPLSGEDYTGVRWNKVGNIFYNEGLAVITDPSLLDFGEPGYDWSGKGDLLQVTFRGDSRVPVKIFNCRMGPSQLNASNNPSFTFPEPVRGPVAPTYQRYVVARPPPVTYITGIGIYNENRELVAVAKLAAPIRKREQDRIDIRLRMDF